MPRDPRYTTLAASSKLVISSNSSRFRQIIPEEGMAMKSAPGSISPPAECRDQLQMGPRTSVRVDGASGSSFWKIMTAFTFLGF